MKQIKTHHLNHKKSLNHQFKLSGIALIMTMTLIGYGINPTSSVMAKESADVKADTHLTSEQALEKQIQQRSEEHTSELQSRFDLVCRLLLAQNKLPSPL